MTQRLRELGISGAFIAVAALFFGWGFISSNNDPLIIAMRGAFKLNYTEALMIQLVSFLANGLASFPAAAMGNRLGAVNTILIALATMASGCLLVRWGVMLDSYPAVLGALFVLAVGITTLQVAANPLAAMLGPPQTSHFRLNLAQTFNSLGVVLGVNYGSFVMLGGSTIGSHVQSMPDNRATVLQAVGGAFASLALLLGLLLVAVFLQRFRIGRAAAESTPQSRAPVLAALRSRWAIFGALSIGLYVGAEVSIGSIMIAFLHQPAVLGLPFEQGGFYLANLYWGGALLGRIVGSVLLTRSRADHLLVFCASMAALLCVIAFCGIGAVSGYAALAVGLFNSIMFPTIFTLTLERSEVSKSATSGLLVLAISFGGAIPFLVARLADTAGLAFVFAVPALAYALILIFALRVGATASRLKR
ncbi:MAG: MFS transporter [Novosphingobium sp.]|uniref:MFS transporter n=1 Tax=Novosphingobium sp. TaxID=1874826 RepID=UPI0032B9576D